VVPNYWSRTRALRRVSSLLFGDPTFGPRIDNAEATETCSLRVMLVPHKTLPVAARSWRAEAVEHGQFAMIEIRQPQYSATVIRLDSLFAHDDGLPCRRIGTTAHTVWAMQALALGSGVGVLSANAWLRKLTNSLRNVCIQTILTRGILA
jgi:hypothetical protein